MSGVLRTWGCLSQRCRRTFDSWEPNPVCPSCGNVRVSWVPAGGHSITEACKTADAEFRKLAETFGMSDMSASHGSRQGVAAKPRLPSTADKTPAMSFAPGFSSAPYAVDKNGGVHAVCEPSRNNVTFKTRVGTNTPLSPSKAYPNIATGTRIEARHTGRS